MATPHPSRPHRWLFITLGFLLVGLGALGVVLPVLPTTIFLILAAACFARSSERWHQWLLNNRIFGPTIRDWETRRCIPKSVKLIAIGAMAAVGCSSIIFALETTLARVLTTLLIFTGLATVWWIPTCQCLDARNESDGEET